MPKFRFCVTRDVTESVWLTVDAPTIQDAHTEGLSDIDKYADQTDGCTSWELDDYPSMIDVYVADTDDYSIVEDKKAA